MTDNQDGFDEIAAHEAFNPLDAKYEFLLDEFSFKEGAKWQFNKDQEELKALKSQLGIAREALKEFALGESQFMDGVECMHKAREALKEIE